MSLYETNQDFKEYVDRYCMKHKITVEEALTHELVKEVGLMYENNKIGG